MLMCTLHQFVSCGSNSEHAHHQWRRPCADQFVLCGSNRAYTHHQWRRPCADQCVLCGSNRAYTHHQWRRPCADQCVSCGSNRAYTHHQWRRPCAEQLIEDPNRGDIVTSILHSRQQWFGMHCVSSVRVRPGHMSCPSSVNETLPETLRCSWHDPCRSDKESIMCSLGCHITR